MVREADIERYFVDAAQLILGAEVRKAKWLDRRGAPDRIVFYAGEVYLVEFKAPQRKPNVHQEREMFRLKQQGANVYVIDSIKQCDEVINKWLHHKRH